MHFGCHHGFRSGPHKRIIPIDQEVLRLLSSVLSCKAAATLRRTHLTFVPFFLPSRHDESGSLHAAPAVVNGHDDDRPVTENIISLLDHPHPCPILFPCANPGLEYVFPI